MFLLLRTIAIILLFNLLLATPAYAYLDPNAGGFFLQVVIPFVFAAAAAITVFWRRVIGTIKSFISRLRGNSINSHEE